MTLIVSQFRAPVIKVGKGQLMLSAIACNADVTLLLTCDMLLPILSGTACVSAHGHHLLLYGVRDSITTECRDLEKEQKTAYIERLLKNESNFSLVVAIEYAE